MGTKKEAAKRKADWNRAILEGRVLKLNHGQTMKEEGPRTIADKLLEARASREDAAERERIYGRKRRV
jgi:hypothetical protein